MPISEVAGPSAVPGGAARNFAVSDFSGVLQLDRDGDSVSIRERGFILTGLFQRSGCANRRGDTRAGR